MSKYKPIVNLGTDAIVVALLSMFAFVPLKNTKAQETVNNITSEKATNKESRKEIIVIGKNTSLKPGVSLLMKQVRPYVEADL